METNYFNIRELDIKPNTKSEMYRILTVEGQLYFSSMMETFIEFIGEIVKGDKKVTLKKFILFSDSRHRKSSFDPDHRLTDWE